MATDVIKFVDSIAASPTVRLDVNDGTTWRTTRLNAPPPRLRRAQSSNAMTDGGFVSSSTYDMRTITLELALVHSSEDNAATEWQKLARELDRADNFLMYQPTGATKPVFFRVFRSDVPAFEQFTGGSQAFKKPTVELLAEPFAIGLRETLGPFTVNNDPAAGSNGLFFDVTGVIGDVATDMVWIDRTATRSLAYLAVRQHGTPSNLTFWVQAESATLGTDTTNPGGGPDAAMSGTGTNNFVRTSFATVSALVARVTATVLGTTADERGRFRVMAVVRRSDATSDMQISASFGVTGATLTIPKTTARQAIDLGLFSIGTAMPDRLGGYAPPTRGYALGLLLNAGRTSGTGTLDWDFVAIVPCDEATVIYANGTSADSTTPDGVLDGGGSSYFSIVNGADPWATGPSGLPFTSAPLTGGVPQLVPNQTNRLYSLFLTASSGYRGMDKTATGSIEVHYWPRYLLVRPSAS